MNHKLAKEIIYSTCSHGREFTEIIDADWKESYGFAVIIRESKKSIIQLNGVEVDIPFTPYSLSRIRWIDRQTFLVSTFENEEDESNLFIVDLNEGLMHAFQGGEGIQDIVVGKEGIWISYFDEGVFGSGISTEGLVLFDVTGKVLFRYLSDLKDRPDISDCYALCKGNGATIWLFPYTDFPLVQANPETRTARSFPIPEILHGSNALSVRGNDAYFFDPYHSNQKLYHLELDTQKPLLLGTLPGRLRGLDPSGKYHFISITEQEVLLYRVIDKDKYHCL
ncbi:TetR family transcriptional regulator [Planococcus chinensis]|uniref:TetR family transcriptional regulator n=1 Tax=Planococcus chinensis TaxID=272917 RepID=A0ABW4QKM7_9BACL